MRGWLTSWVLKSDMWLLLISLSNTPRPFFLPSLSNLCTRKLTPPMENTVISHPNPHFKREEFIPSTTRRKTSCNQPSLGIASPEENCLHGREDHASFQGQHVSSDWSLVGYKDQPLLLPLERNLKAYPGSSTHMSSSEALDGNATFPSTQSHFPHFLCTDEHPKSTP